MQYSHMMYRALRKCPQNIVTTTDNRK